MKDSTPAEYFSTNQEKQQTLSSINSTAVASIADLVDLLLYMKCSSLTIGEAMEIGNEALKAERALHRIRKILRGDQ